MFTHNVLVHTYSIYSHFLTFLLSSDVVSYFSEGLHHIILFFFLLSFDFSNLSASLFYSSLLCFLFFLCFTLLRIFGAYPSSFRGLSLFFVFLRFFGGLSLFFVFIRFFGSYPSCFRGLSLFFFFLRFFGGFSGRLQLYQPYLRRGFLLYYYYFIVIPPLLSSLASSSLFFCFLFTFSLRAFSSLPTNLVLGGCQVWESDLTLTKGGVMGESFATIWVLLVSDPEIGRSWG